MRVAVFGSFFPHFEYSATFTTGLTYLLSRVDDVDSITVYGPEDSTLPRWLDGRLVKLRPCWVYDDPLSLGKCASQLIKDSVDIDLFLCNIYLTSFGRNHVVNAVGLMIPTVVAMRTGRPVGTYAHNFLETQDVERLGYSPGFATRFATRLLELALIRSTTVVFPLASQAAAVNRAFRSNAGSQFIPYVDAVHTVEDVNPPGQSPVREASSPTEILLFGSWGPQKDLAGAARMLNTLIQSGHNLRILVAGSMNRNFKSAMGVAETSLQSLPKGRVTIQWDVPYDQVAPLFRRADVLFMPYVTTGGHSGVMSTAAFHSLPIIAYDLPQLRECAEQLGAWAEFIRPGDISALERALERVHEISKLDRTPSVLGYEQRLANAVSSVKGLLNVISSRRR